MSLARFRRPGLINHVPARQPVARHCRAADTEKQDSHNQKKGSRGKKLFPLAFFSPFLGRKGAPPEAHPNVAGRRNPVDFPPKTCYNILLCYYAGLCPAAKEVKP